MESNNFTQPYGINTINKTTTESSHHQTFSNWKLNLDCLYQDIFGQRTENLPDMPYWSMYEEKVEENLIIQRMQQILDSVE